MIAITSVFVVMFRGSGADLSFDGVVEGEAMARGVDGGIRLATLGFGMSRGSPKSFWNWYTQYWIRGLLL